jgi:cytochrome c
MMEPQRPGGFAKPRAQLGTIVRALRGLCEILHNPGARLSFRRCQGTTIAHTQIYSFIGAHSSGTQSAAKARLCGPGQIPKGRDTFRAVFERKIGYWRRTSGEPRRAFHASHKFHCASAAGQLHHRANAAGDAKAGAAVLKRCAVCHTSDKGGGDALGPNLFGIVGRKAAGRPGLCLFGAAAKRPGIVWSEANLDQMGAAGPARMVPGNKMAFPGITSKKQQADVVAYLGTLK